MGIMWPEEHETIWFEACLVRYHATMRSIALTFSSGCVCDDLCEDQCRQSISQTKKKEIMSWGFFAVTSLTVFDGVSTTKRTTGITFKTRLSGRMDSPSNKER